MIFCGYQGLTAYHDIALDKCYIIELNTTIVMPPHNLKELLMNVKVTQHQCTPPWNTNQALVLAVIQ